MRALELNPKTAAKDIASRSYIITIAVFDVCPVLIDRLSKAIERHLRNSSESIVIATNNAVSAKFDCACAIRYPKIIKKEVLQATLRSRHIFPCFGEAGALGKRVVHVDAKPTEDLDDSALRSLKDLWSKQPWTLVYEGAGAAAGMHIPLPFRSNLALSSLEKPVPEGLVCSPGPRRASAAVSLRFD